ncbi:hypothetical protein GCM10023116_25920 [Kistimonas scapharcae]|uniref:Uncharacterized protein n=1 Tax=Kistimonas scapharcae TaxID=1036133 RepID=A0ABP8V4I1_9GAMM
MRLYIQPSFSVKKGSVAPVKSGASSNAKAAFAFNGVRRTKCTGSSAIAKLILSGSAPVHKTRYERMEMNIRKIVNLHGADNEALYQEIKKDCKDFIDAFNKDRSEYMDLINTLKSVALLKKSEATFGR